MDSIKGRYSKLAEKIVKQESNVNNDLFILDRHVIKVERCFSIDKLTSKKLYSIL